MKTILKYTFTGGEINEYIPSGAEVLDAQDDGKNISVWFLVDTSNEKTLRKLRLYMTGNELPMAHGRYVSTLQKHGLDFHVFDMGG